MGMVTARRGEHFVKVSRKTFENSLSKIGDVECGEVETQPAQRLSDFDIDVNELITSAIKGNVDNQTIGKKILAQLFSGAREAISTIRKHYGNYNNI